LNKSLRKDDAAHSFEVEFRPGEDGLRVTVKETIGTTSTKSILFKATLPLIDDPKEGLMSMLTDVSRKLQRDTLHTASQEKTIAEYTTLVETLTSDTKEMGLIKDRLQDEMIAKMCMVLNCKKREIERLQQQVAQLEAAATRSGVIDLTDQPGTASGDATNCKRSIQAAAKKAPARMATAKVTKEKAATASARAKPAAAKRKRRRAVDSDSEVEEVDGDREDSEEEPEASDSSGGSRGRLSDSAEEGSDADEGDEGEEQIPMVTQSSTSHTQQSHGAASSSSGGGGSGSGGGNSTSMAAVTLSLPPMSAPATQAVPHSDSEDDLLPSKRRKANITQPTSAAPSQSAATSSARAGASKPAAVPPSQAPSSQSSGAAAATAKSGALSKFYAEEDSDADSGDCMAYMN
jgi:hypothetical protein